MFESIDGRLSGRCSLHEFRTATDVISGHRQAVERVIKMAEEKGAAIHLFECQCAFSHVSMIRSASEQFQTVLHRYSFRDAAWSIISNVTARPYSAEIDQRTSQAT